MRQPVQMVVVNGVRYRPEDAPKGADQELEVKARTPRNKARAPGTGDAPVPEKSK